MTQTVIKKVKDRFWEKKADFIIYEHKGQRWVFEPTGCSPISPDDAMKIIKGNLK